MIGQQTVQLTDGNFSHIPMIYQLCSACTVVLWYFGISSEVRSYSSRLFWDFLCVPGNTDNSESRKLKKSQLYEWEINNEGFTVYKQFWFVDGFAEVVDFECTSAMMKLNIHKCTIMRFTSIRLW